MVPEHCVQAVSETAKVDSDTDVATDSSSRRTLVLKQYRLTISEGTSS